MNAVEAEAPFQVDETKEHLRAIIQTQSDIVTTGLDPEALMSLVVERTRELTGGTGAMVELTEGQELVVRAACGSVAGWLGRRRPQTEAASETRSVRAGEPRWRDEIEQLQELQADGCPRADVRSRISVPLRYRERILGALSVVSGSARAFGERDERTMCHMADLIAASLSHATAFEAKALRDPLTGLANRALFVDRLNLALARARRRPCVTVFFVDLDDFKNVNDSLGHAAGDELLAQVSARLHEACRPSDTVARWGGDEFTILSEELVGSNGAIELAGRITRVLARPFMIAGMRVNVTASIGIAQAHDPWSEPERIIEVADGAMYRAKKRRAPPAGKGGSPQG